METRRIIQILAVVVLLVGAFVISVLYLGTDLLGVSAGSASSAGNTPGNDEDVDHDNSVPDNIDEHADDVKVTGENPPGENTLPGPGHFICKWKCSNRST